MTTRPSLNQPKKQQPYLYTQAKQSTNLLSLTSAVMVVSSQIVWNKISHSKTLVLCLLATLIVVGTVVWNQASDYYKSLALIIFQNQRLAQENQQQLQNTLQIWQKATSLQPNSDVLNSEINELLPHPAFRNQTD